MKNQKQHISNAENEEHEDTEGEENEECRSCSTAFISREGDKCPICLNCLLEQEIGVPDNCSHAFCVACILKWAELGLFSS
uniref:RING-type domain-containing protein n=1 Tax=Nothoprocta perdicaria TaxID=30464 RepID=A0A8C6Z3K5_NOTPE